jgi:arylsulfatase A-like enzyme
VTRTAKTNAQGAFSLPVVRAGNYSLQAAADGFVAETQSATVPAAATSAAAFTLAKRRPNIVMIVADDLGYADLGVQGSAEIVTPNIDSIARNGIRFTQGYVTAPVCNASRAALLTGRYQQRFGVELLSNPSLPLSETMLSERLKPLGYATGLVGKWHLGSQAQFLPQQRGYDEFFGFLPALHSYTVWNQPGNPILRGTQAVSENTYLTDAFTREAVDFIQRKQSQPFYLYLAYNAAHSPLQATPEYLARNQHISNNNRRTFAAMMTALDDGVGKVLAKLRELNLEENTLVIFHSDNGGDPSDNTSLNTPFNGEKFQLYEGGIRVPVMLQWKGYLPAGVVNTTPVIALDMFTTAVSAALGSRFSDARLDGVNLFPFLKGVETAPPHEVLYWRYGAPQYAVRAGDWKLLFLENTLRLYDLATDPGERTNLAETNPAKRNELKLLYDQWNAQLPPAP